MSPKKILIVVVGPTAVGKTTLAIDLAKHFHTSIISADSRQFYKEMTIGTAKPSPEELAQVQHYFIDSHSISEDYSAGDFEREALGEMEDLFKNKDVLVAVGGSGLFVRALTEGLDELPKAPDQVRDSLNKWFAQEGLEPLKRKLQEIDPDYYAKCDTDNPQRVIRAIEVFEASGKPISHFITNQKSQREFEVLTIGLNMDRDKLYERINFRVDKMIEAGLMDEVKSLMPFRQKPALLTVGYAELFEFLDAKITLDEAISRIKQNSRRYAKRQITWFKKYGNTHWFQPEQTAKIIEFIEGQIQTN